MTEPETAPSGPIRTLSAAANAVALMVRIAAGTATAWLVPERLWLPITRGVGRLTLRFTRRAPPAGVSRAVTNATDRTVEGTAGASAHGLVARATAVERIATGHASRLYGLRLYRPGSRPPPIELRGADRLQRSLDPGNGAILWVARFAFAPLFFKIALYQAGWAVSHLSRPAHGFAASPFAVRRLNPIWTRIEERYVHERIVMQPGAETAALRTLRRRLKDNRVVSITVGDEAVRTVEVPFLGGVLHIATGPINLAGASGAPLLPVFAIREPDGTFAVEIQTPLDTTSAADRRTRFTSVARQYAERLEPFVRHYPGQWIP